MAVMIKKYRLLVIAMFAFACLVVINSGSCVYAASRDWTVPLLGVFQVPEEFQAAKIKDFKKLADGQKDKLIVKQGQAGSPKDKVAAKDWFTTVDLTGYQVTLNDGTAYHLGWIGVLKDSKQIAVEEAAFFEQELPVEQKLILTIAHQMVNSNIQKMVFMDEKTKSGVKLLEMQPIEIVVLDNKKMYAVGVRMLAQSDNLIFPLYGKVYIFNADNHLAGAMLITLDSDRDFWNSTFGDMMNSLQMK